MFNCTNDHGKKLVFVLLSRSYRSFSLPLSFVVSKKPFALFFLS